MAGTETRKHKTWKGMSAVGGSTVFIECPFCGRVVEAFVWSLAGCGKCCPNPSCGAIHHYFENMSLLEVRK
jgi:hypothetical protein